MSVRGILETALYVDNLERAVDFYTRIFDLKPMVKDERFCALNVADRHVLLLFLRGGTSTTLTLPGGTIPPHDGHGQTHFAFSIDAADVDLWKKRLADHGVAIEGTMVWPPGGVSLYFRDPDGHLAELASPGIWPMY